MSNLMRSHGMKFRDEDWQTLEAEAAAQNTTVNALIHSLCKVYLEGKGKTWQGAQRVGRPKLSIGIKKP